MADISGRPDAKEFWENKLLDWEAGRYGAGNMKKRGGLLERVADKASRSLRFRLRTSVELLEPYISGKRVLELGCGSGIVAGAFMTGGAAEYLGVDISERAIAAARDRYKADKWDRKLSFKVGTTESFNAADHDIVFSLGLLDWLSDSELSALFERQEQLDFPHAISERRVSLAQWVHRGYVQLSYGFRSGAYVPRYYDCASIAELGRRHRLDPVYAYRDPRLSFGTLLSSFPVGPQIDASE